MPEPSRTEVIERLREAIPPDEPQPSQDSAGRSRREWKQTLIAAVAFLEAGESRTEYRVVGDAPGPFVDFKVDEIYHLPAAVSWRDEKRREGYFSNVRIQQRTVFETEWTDLEEAEDCV